MKNIIMSLPFFVVFVISFSIGLADAQNYYKQNDSTFIEENYTLGTPNKLKPIQKSETNISSFYDNGSFNFQPIPEDPGVEVAPLPLPSSDQSDIISEEPIEETFVETDISY